MSDGEQITLARMQTGQSGPSYVLSLYCSLCYPSEGAWDGKYAEIGGDNDLRCPDNRRIIKPDTINCYPFPPRAFYNGQPSHSKTPSILRAT